MWKIVIVLLLTALAIFMARLAYDAPVIQTRIGLMDIETMAGSAVTPALMYAGIRG